MLISARQSGVSPMSSHITWRETEASQATARAKTVLPRPPIPRIPKTSPLQLPRLPTTPTLLFPSVSKFNISLTSDGLFTKSRGRLRSPYGTKVQNERVQNEYNEMILSISFIYY